MIRQSAGKSFAYILGVYLGDGAVTAWKCAGKSDRLMFRLNTIDEDFAKATKAALEDLTDYMVTIGSHAVSKSSKPNWYLALGDRALCERLVGETEKKAKIPDYVFHWSHDLKLAFIAGLMDSEGHVAANGNTTSRRYHMGFRNTALWFDDLMKIFQSVGIVIGRIGVDKLPSGKLYRRATIKMQSWITSGARFNIARKQARVDEWAATVPYSQRSRHPAKLTSETLRQTSP